MNYAGLIDGALETWVIGLNQMANMCPADQKEHGKVLGLPENVEATNVRWSKTSIWLKAVFIQTEDALFSF